MRTEVQQLTALVAATLITIAGGTTGAKWLAADQHSTASGEADRLRDRAVVTPRIGGYVTAILVQENQTVKAGDVLARIDDRDLQAALAAAKQTVGAASAKLASINAQIRRQAGGVATDALKTARAAAVTDLAKAEDAAHQAEINLGYATIIAPIDGIVGARRVGVGQFIQAGDALMAVVPPHAVYVVAGLADKRALLG
jgi:membrane fusion protein (multidrug efflux system)